MDESAKPHGTTGTTNLANAADWAKHVAGFLDHFSHTGDRQGEAVRLRAYMAHIVISDPPST